MTPMSRRFSLRLFLKAQKGVAAIEMALILPFMLFLYFGLLDLTGLISFNRKITAVASSIADLTGQNRNYLLKADLTDYFKVVGMIMEPTPDSDVTVQVYGYRKVSGTVTQVWSTNNSKGPGCSTTPNVTAIDPLMSVGNDVIVTIACMQYTPYVATFLGKNIIGATSFNVEQAIMLRPRSSLQLECYATTQGGAKCT